MILKEEQYNRILIDFMEVTRLGRITEDSLKQLQDVQDSVASKVGMGPKDGSGLYDIFEFCERNQIEDDSVVALLEQVRTIVQNNKN